MREKLTQQKRKRIRRYLYLFFLVAGVCLLIYARFFLPQLLKNISLFSLKNIVIEPPGYASFLKEYISIPENTSLFSIDMQEIYSRLRQIYFVEDCTIEKHLPDTLLIRIKIRSPWLLVVDERSASLMDRNGYFLPLDENFKGWNVEGIKVGSVGTRTDQQEKLSILKEIEQWYNYYGIGNMFEVDTISIKDLNKIELKSGDRSIYIQSQEIGKQLDIAKQILSSCEKNNFLFEYIDVRFKQPYVKERTVKSQ